MKNDEKMVRRVRIDIKTLEDCRNYFPGLSIDKLVQNSLENELRRKQKKRLKHYF